MVLANQLVAARLVQGSKKTSGILHFVKKIWFIIKDMDPWIHGSAAGAAARAAAGAAAGAAASAATVCTYYVIIGGALRALLYLQLYMIKYIQ